MSCFLFYCLVPLLLVVAVVDLATMGADNRQALKVRCLNRAGLSQRAIASQLSISRHRVRVYLA